MTDCRAGKVETGGAVLAHDGAAEFVNEVLANTPEHYDGDNSGEAIAVRYVRDLEAVADAAEAIVNETGIGMYRAANGAGWRRLQEALWTIRGTWPE